MHRLFVGQDHDTVADTAHLVASIDVEPHVVVSIATGFIRGGYSAKELAQQWSARGAIIGVREYYVLSIWTKDMPSRARAAQLDYLRTSIHFHGEWSTLQSCKHLRQLAADGRDRHCHDARWSWRLY